MMSSRMAATRALWDLVTLTGGFKNEKTILRTFSQTRPNMSRATYSRKLRRMQQNGLIKKRRLGHEHVFIITDKAKRLRRKAITKILRTDGWSTLIVFDIPEEKHNARDTFRRFLIRNGYTQMRRSAFLSPFGVSKDIKALIKELRLEKNISVFAVKPEQMF